MAGRSASPRISVVVTTYERAASLARLVGGLESQTLGTDQFEVIVADDGSTDDTPHVLGRLRESTPLDLRVVRNDRNRGPAAGRNLGWRVARAPVVAFTDDDCWPQPTWLEAGLAAMT